MGVEVDIQAFLDTSKKTQCQKTQAEKTQAEKNSSRKKTQANFGKAQANHSTTQ